MLRPWRIDRQSPLRDQDSRAREATPSVPMGTVGRSRSGTPMDDLNLHLRRAPSISPSSNSLASIQRSGASALLASGKREKS